MKMRNPHWPIRRFMVGEYAWTAPRRHGHQMLILRLITSFLADHALTTGPF